MSAVTIDGIALDRVVKKLRFDIEALQREVAENAGLEFSDDMIQGVVDTVVNTLDKKKVYTSVEAFKTESMATQRQLQTLSSDVDSRFLHLEKTMRADFDGKLQRMAEGYDRDIGQLNTAVKDLRSVQEKHAGQLTQTSVRIDGLEERLAATKKDLLTRHNHLHQELISVMDCKVNDTFSLVDARLNKLDTDVFKAVHRHTEALAVFDTRMQDTSDRLEAVESTFATQVDMVLKADITSLATKADRDVLDVVEEQVRTAILRLDSITATAKAANEKLEKDLTTRTDAKAEWILRTLRKELREKASTDIGKVKCLVCDQPIPQKENVESSVFGGAPLKPHIATGRPQSAVTGGEERERGGSPGGHMDGNINNKASFRKDAPRQRPQSASGGEPSYQYNRKLVTMGAAPTNNILTAILREQQQRLCEVFEEENSVYSQEMAGSYDQGDSQRRLQAPPSQQFPPARAGSNNQQGSVASSQETGRISADYFRELENKYAHPSTGRANPLLAAANKRRPGSAPAHKSRK